jgi:hypothetical protein
MIAVFQTEVVLYRHYSTGYPAAHNDHHVLRGPVMAPPPPPVPPVRGGLVVEPPAPLPPVAPPIPPVVMVPPVLEGMPASIADGGTYSNAPTSVRPLGSGMGRLA